jgi:hypothetical protein
MNEGSGGMSTTKKEGRTRETGERIEKGHRQTKKEYLERTCHEITEFQRTGSYDLMHMKAKELGWKGNHWTKKSGIEESQGNIIVD